MPLPSGGGKMGDRIRNFDWRSHLLGPPENWHPTLLTTLGICLHSSIPTAIYWGPELRLLYNDAWSAVPADRHPWALGRPAKEVWTDIWHIIEPQFANVISSGVGFSTHDQMLPMLRGGEVRETFWNYSFTPILDENAKVLGIFNQGTEATSLVLAARARAVEIERLRETFSQAPGAIAILRGPEHRFEIANTAYLELIGERGPLIGSSVAEALPEVVEQGFVSLLDDVYRSGKPYIGHGVSVDLVRRGVRETRIVDFIYQPTLDVSGSVDGIFVQATDVTERALAERSLRQTAARRVFLDELQRQTHALRDASEILAISMRVTAAHLGAALCAYADMEPDENGFTIRGDWAAPGQRSIVGRYALADFGALAVSKLRGGEPLVISDNRRELPPEEAAAFQTLGITATVCMPLVKQGRLVALMAVHHASAHAWSADEIALIREVTERSWAHVERVGAEQEARASELRYQMLFDSIDEGFCIIEFIDGPNGPLDDYVHVAANAAYADNAGIANVVGRRVREMVPAEAESWIDLYRGVLESGRNIRFEKELEATRRWLEVASVRVEPASRKQVAVLFKDISGRKRAEQALRMSEDRLRLATEAALIGTWDFDPQTGELRWDARCKALFGLHPDTQVTYGDGFLTGLHPEDRDRVDAAVQFAIRPGGSPDYDIEYRTIGIQDGVERWIAAKGSAIFESGRAVRFIGTVLDITARKRAERRFELVNQIGAAVAAERNIDRIVQQITDAGVELTGAEFGAFFYNKVDESGESLMLYSLSGVPREHFEQFPMPRNTEVFAPTFGGVAVVRSDDIRKDPRYGKNLPYAGMPQGHLPVVSYLAIPVCSKSGEVLGGLFFGHKEPGVFRAEHEVLLSGLAGQAATAIDNSRLIGELQTLNTTLEQRIEEALAERARTEEQLRQSQKMEAIGQLTGGIAHDFNNMLAVVIGALNLMQRRLDRGDNNVKHYVEAATDGAKRASSLTQRLLAFSRLQPLEPAALDANKLVNAMTELLTRTLGEHIQVETVLTPGLWRCFVDHVQLESTVLNLAVNARDAMPDGGKLTIETGNALVDERIAREYNVPEGQYVLVAVTDTGSGMGDETMAQAFNPFFTTKAVGKGSGLGLSQVFGFVRQSGGHVKLYSELGIGTSVKIYLPRHTGPEQSADIVAIAETLPMGDRGEIVLVVEDEERVRHYSVEALRELGYSVIAASSPRDALRVIESRQHIDLLFTDIVMPEMNGRQLAERALVILPTLKVLYTTGYTRNAVVHNGVLDQGTVFLQKPFTIDQLSSKVRQVLDS
jgi:PAS domain S-box-containing protein